MAETFPLDGFRRNGIRIRSGQSARRDRGGLLLTHRRTEPYWGGPLETDHLHPAERADVLAFLVECVDRNLRVDFVHPRYRVPRAYTLATWPLALDPSLVAVPNRRQIGVSGLQLGMALKRGDRLTLIQGELRCHRMLAADVVVSSTLGQLLSVTPRLPIGVFTPGAVVRFRDPPLRLAIVPDSFDNDEVYAPTPIVFETEEALI